MKNLNKKLIIAALTYFPAVALAVTPPGGVPQTQVQDVNQVYNIIKNVVSWIGALFFAVLVAYYFYAAYLYLTSAGDEGKLTEAKNNLIYAIVATVIGLLAYSIVGIVQNFIK
ncbi:MAG: hypothetical protein A3I89_02825 [Candidatus Harrisonbacteria bacterium RIFCSPLOWO2_02_FULL_41_11]|uniref:Uncharacterized protein n=1 Tax=Candidatus Harrisonbacteria bacterium RIFCSPHIGHO2_02_FULL_42_16 TaxID=1798404 RepID=A0A1G1ZGJ6_9BACT|nr:MAG: hypothetical protein A3B92_03280 [Candidatus Harrisonbacteria bacterium RIFCSPHIGHO2_02_FULL_42_16]OGY67320.1 MAG: hypothetical protein A3I89_02825 [Candidatus Harrisonbacteria bacterium RIFCSPLOWO2_02_FULL_41_11]